MERTAVTGPVLDERTGRVVGVTAKPVDDRGRRIGDDETYRAPVVIAADGVSARLAIALGLERRENRPMGVAVRAYYETPAPRRRLAGVLARALGRQARTSRTCCPATAGSSASATAPPTSASASSTPRKAFQQRRLQGRAAALARRTRPGVGLPRGEPRRPDRRRPRCRWASTASRTTRAGCCSSATPAAWSTRSTARASTTRWSPARWPPRRSCRRWPDPTGPARERVLEGYAAALDAGVRRLLHARPGLREDDRQPDVHEAGHEVRPAAHRR